MKAHAPSLGVILPVVRLLALCPTLLLAVGFVLIGPHESRAQTPTAIEMNGFRGRELRSAAFELTAPAQLELKVVGAEPGGLERFHNLRLAFVELMSNVMDVGERDVTWTANAWILDARTREPVWELAEAETGRSGQGLRKYEGTLSLPAGRYEVHYAAFPLGTSGYDRGQAHRLMLRIGGARVHPVESMGPGDAAVWLGARDTDLARTAFEVTRSTAVELRMVGEANSGQAYDYGWIESAATGEMVWKFDAAQSVHAGGAERNRLVKQTLALEPGRYVAWYRQSRVHGPGNWFYAPPYDPAGWGISLRVAEGEAGVIRPFDYEPVPAEYVVASVTGVGNNALERVGFTVNRPVEVRIFALGESSGRALQDYARILRARTRENVWTMTLAETRHAGGSAMNRVYRGALRLEPGDYLLEYTTDRSHAYDAWSDSAPLDAELWGVSLFTADAADASAFEPFDFENDPLLLVRIDQMGNGQTTRRRFVLHETAELLIYALGEGYESRGMDDGARITDASGRTVWEMRYEATQPAGGSERNRVYRGTITLPAGEYEVVYRTDSAHAYRSWQASPPGDPAGWGVTLYRARSTDP